MNPLDSKGKTPPKNAGERRAHTAGRLDVVSCGIGFPGDADTLALLRGADTVYGSRSLLAACPVALKDARIIGAKAREDAAEALALCRTGRRVVALASGDALYHGFGGTLSALCEKGDGITYHPGITAFQALFHRLGLPWDAARLFCAHSGGSLPARDIVEAPLSVTYAGTRYPADAVARALLDVHPASGRRAAVIAERLGSPDERILSGPLEDLARTACGPTSVLVVFPERYAKNDPRQSATGTPGGVPDPVREPAARLLDAVIPGPLASATGPDTRTARVTPNAAAPDGLADASDAPESRPADTAPTAIPAPILALGLPEADYARENNLITASDVRAVILSRLRLPAWGTLWDIGAGSGSVGLEAAALRPNLDVHGVERKPERGALIERNRLRMGIANYTLHVGDALGAVRDTPSLPDGNIPTPSTEGFPLPAPDRVFIGGGGGDLPELLAACLRRLRPGGLIVASAVTLESFAALLAWSPERRIGLCRLDIADEQPIAGTNHHLKHRNTIHVFTFRKETTA